MGNLTEGPIDQLKEMALAEDKNVLREILQNCHVKRPGEAQPKGLSEEEQKEYGAIFAHQFEIDMAKSGFDSLTKRNEQMTKLYQQAGFTTPQKKLAMLKQGDYKSLIIPTNFETVKFSRVMQYQSLQLIKCFLAQYAKNEDPENLEADFETVAKQRMKDEVSETTAIAATYSLSLQQSKHIKESQIDEMIVLLDRMKPMSLFDQRPIGLFNEIKHRRICKALSNMLRKARVSESLRIKCVRLMLKTALVHGSASTLLKAANFALFFKVDLTNDMDYIYNQPERQEIVSEAEPLTDISLDDENMVTVMAKVRYNDEVPSYKTVSSDKFVTDGEHWFFMRENGGLGRAKRSEDNSMIEPFKFNIEAKLNDCQLFIMKHRLFARHSGAPDLPFVEIDKDTLDLKQIPENTHSCDSLKWTPLDTAYEENKEQGNRWMRSCPLYFDGEQLHALVGYTVRGHQDAMVKFVVETYSLQGQTVSLASVMNLCKFDAESGEIVNWLPGNEEVSTATITCNETHLIVCLNTSAHVFDRRTDKVGKFIKEISVSASRCIHCYDPAENTFYVKDVAGINFVSFLKRFKLDGFTQRHALPPPFVFTNFKKEMLQVSSEAKKAMKDVRSPVVDPFYELMHGEAPEAVQPTPLPEKQTAKSSEQLYTVTKAMILNVMGQQAQSTMRALDEHEGPLQKDQIFDYIKRPLSVEVSTEFISLVVAELEAHVNEAISQSNVIRQAINAPEDLMQLNQVLMLLKLLTANLRSAQKCRVNLKDLLGKNMAGLVDVAVPAAETVIGLANAFIEEAQKDRTREQEPYTIYMRHMLEAATQLNGLIGEMIPFAFLKNIRKLQSAINALNQKKESNEQFIVGMLKLVNQKIVQECLESEEITHKLKRVLKLILVNQNQTIATRLGQALNREEPAKLRAIDEQMARFANLFCQELLYALASDLMMIAEYSQFATEDVEGLEPEQLQKLELYEKAKRRKSEIESIFYETFIMVSTYYKQQLFKVTAMVWEANIHLWDEGADSQKQLYQQLLSMLSGEASLTKLITQLALGISCYIPSVTWLDEIAEALSNCMTGCSAFIDMTNNYPSKYNRTLRINCINTYLQQVMRNLQYSLGNVACQLIQRDYGRSDEESAQLARLNILQGGIEKRFIPALSSKAKRQIEGSFKIVQDAQLRELSLQDISQIEQTKHDQILLKIVSFDGGQRGPVEDVITIMQQQLQKKRPMVPHARLGGQDGMKLTRSAFVLILKFSQQVDKFIDLTKEVSYFSTRTLPSADKLDQIKDMLEEAESDNYACCLSRWEQASQMRKWTSFVKQQISERVNSEVAEEFKKEIPDFSGIFTEDQNQQIEDLSYARFDIELQITYQQVYEKAKFLLMLKVPQAFVDAHRKSKSAKKLQKASTVPQEDIEQMYGAAKPQPPQPKDDQFAVTMIKRSTARQSAIVIMNNAAHMLKDVEVDWRDKLREWRKVQLSSGAVTSMDQAAKANNSMRNSVLVSVLGCLQASFSVEKLQNKVEEQLVKGLRRSAGLQVIEFAMQSISTEEVFYDALQWFMGSLLMNKSCATHYLAGLEGCGSDVEQSIQKKFFSIIKRVIFQLKQESNSDKIVHLINAIGCWEYKPSDHKQLIDCKVVNALINPLQDDQLHPLYLAWGIEEEFVSLTTRQKEQFSLSARLDQVFQFLTRNVIAGVLVKDESNNVQTGAETAQVKMESFQEGINWGATESLVKSILETIRVNFERFLNNREPAKSTNRLDFPIIRKKKNEDQEEDKEEDPEAEEELGSQEQKDKAVILLDTYDFLRGHGGGRFAIAQNKLKSHQQAEKVQSFIEKVTTTEISQDSPLFKVLEDLIDGMSVSNAINAVVQQRMEACEAIMKLSWDELTLVEPNISVDEITRVTGINQDEWTNALLWSTERTEDFNEREWADTDPKSMFNICVKTKEQKSDIDLVAPFQSVQDYSDVALFKLMELLDTYLSLACGYTSQAVPVAYQVCNPFFLSTLIRLSVEASSNLQFMAHRCLQNILLLDPPVEVLNKAVLDAKRAQGSVQYKPGQQNMVKHLLAQKSPLHFEECVFLQLYFNQLYMARLALYDGVLSEERSQISIVDEAVRTIRISAVVRSKNQQLKEIFDKTLRKAILKRIETLSEPEIDSIMTLIPEAQFERIAVGTPCLDKDGKRFTVIGTQQKNREADSLIIKHTLDFDNQYVQLVGLSYDAQALEQQEIMSEIEPSNVQTLIDLDSGQTIEGARRSLFMDADVAKKLFKILADSIDGNSSMAKKRSLRLLKTFIARGFFAMNEALGNQFVSFLRQVNIQAGLIKQLLQDVQVESTPLDMPLMTATILELKADLFRDQMAESVDNERMHVNSFLLEYQQDETVFKIVAKCAQSGNQQDVTIQILKKFGAKISDSTRLAVPHVHDVSIHPFDVGFVIGSEQLKNMSWSTARYINAARVVITDDDVDFKKLFTVLVEYKRKGLVQLDELDETSFVVINRSDLESIRAVLTQQRVILDQVVEGDPEQEEMETQALQIVERLAQAKSNPDARIDESMASKFKIQKHIDKYAMKNADKKVNQKYLEDKQTELWYNAVCEQPTPWAQLLIRLRRFYSRKLLIAVFTSEETAPPREMMEVFAQGKVPFAYMSNLIHLDCFTTASVNLVLGQDYSLEKEQSDISNVLESLKIFEGFKQAFTNDILVRSEEWLNLLTEHEYGDGCKIKIKHFRKVCSTNDHTQIAGLYPENLVFLQRVVNELDYVDPDDKPDWLVRIFNINLANTVFFGLHKRKEGIIRKKLLEAMCQTLETITLDRECLRNLAKKQNLLDLLFANKLLELLLAQTDVEKFSIFSDANAEVIELPLMLPYIVRIIVQLVAIRQKLKDKFHKMVNFSTELNLGLVKLAESYQIVKEGSEFSTKMRALRTDLILMSSDAPQVRHIRHNYKSPGRLSFNKTFKKRLSAVRESDTLVQVLVYSAPKILQFSINGNERDLNTGMDDKISFRLEAGKTAMLEYPLLGGEFHLTGHLDEREFDVLTKLSKKDGAQPALRVYSDASDVLIEGGDMQFYGMGPNMGKGSNDNEAYVGSNKLRHIPTPAKLRGNVKKVTVGRQVQAILTNDGRVFVHGKCESQAFGYVGPYEYMNKFHEFKDFPVKEDETIVDVAIYKQGLAVVTSHGRLFGQGENFYLSFARGQCTNENNDGNEPFEIKLPMFDDGFLARKLWIMPSSSNVYLQIEKVINDEESIFKIFSTDYDNFWQEELLGLPDGTYFVDMAFQEELRAGIDNVGALWLWGEGRALSGVVVDDGDDHQQQIKKAYRVSYFREAGLKVQKVQVGEHHAVVQVTNQDEKKQLYGLRSRTAEFSVQKLFGYQSKSVHEEIIHQLDIDCDSVKDFSCGKSMTCYVLNEDVEQVASIVPDKPDASGLIHFYKRDGQWQYILAEDYESQKAEIPALSFACSEPITKFDKKVFPELEHLLSQLAPVESYSEQCSVEGAPFGADAPIYVAHFKDSASSNAEQSSWIFASEEQIHSEELQAWDFSSLIWYRVGRPFAQLTEKLPCLNMSEFFVFGEQDNVGVTIFATKQEVVDEDLAMIGLSSSFDQVIKKVSTNFGHAENQAMLKEMSTQMTKKKLKLKEIANFDPDTVVINQQDLPADSPLKSIDNEVLQLRSKLCLIFNQNWMNLACLIDMSKLYEEQTLSNLLWRQSTLVLPIVVNALAEKHLNMGFGKADEESVRISVSRRKANIFIDSGKVDTTGSFTVFGQIFSALEYKGYKSMSPFRKLSLDSQPYKLTFLGEGGIDVGGLFRDSLVNMATELMSPTLRLLTPSPNNKNDFGNYRECFILNSQVRSPTHLKLLYYLGGMLGFNIMTQSPLPLNMAPFFWKQLAGQKTMSIEDLDGIDSYSSQMLSNLQNYGGLLDEEEFEQSVEQMFTTVLSSGDEVELCAGGENKPVTKANLDEFIRMVLKARATESVHQMRALRKGVKAVMRGGIDALALIPWQQIEARACGAKIFDVERFKSITVFPYNENSHPIVERFWRVFESFSEEEKGLYLKFVWGRSRLPMDCSATRRHQVRLIKHLDKRGFPLSHTCFFQLDIPDYEDDDICRERLLTACTLCGQIDMDGQAVDEDD